MQNKAWFSLVLIAGLGAVLSACGADMQATDSLAAVSQNALSVHHPLNALLFEDEQDEASTPDQPSAACKEIQARLKQHREDLKVTKEWQALVHTAAWKKIRADIDQWKKEGCKPHDDHASDACKKIHDQLHGDFDALKKTPEYKAAEKTDQWKTLVKDYDDAHKEGCFKHKK